MAPLRKSPAGSKKELIFTEAELELMQLIWSLETATVHELLQSLPKDRNLAYTTVSTICRILEQKGALRTQREGRSHRYIPTISREAYSKVHLRHTLGHVFSGEVSTLIRCLVSDQKITNDELQELRALLVEQEKGSE